MAADFWRISKMRQHFQSISKIDGGHKKHRENSNVNDHIILPPPYPPYLSLFYINSLGNLKIRQPDLRIFWKCLRTIIKKWKGYGWSKKHYQILNVNDDSVFCPKIDGGQEILELRICKKGLPRFFEI